MALIPINSGATIPINSLGGAIEINGLVAPPAVTPVANFTSSTTTPTQGDVIYFYDTSTNSPTSWSWSFSQTPTYLSSTSSTSQNPVVSFANTGTVNVTLTATNSAGSDAETKNSYITVSASGVAPTAAFTISDDTPDASQTVTFTDTSTGAPTSWLWAISGGSYSFVGGTSSTSQNPQIQFTSGSTSYTITLTATNAFGSGNFVDGVVTNAVGTAPVASFTISDTTPNENQNVTLTNTSSNSPTALEWVLSGTQGVNWSIVSGNLNSSVLVIKYLTGTSGQAYSVNIEVSNSFGSDDTNFTNNISVVSAPSFTFPAAHFEFDPFIYGDADDGGTTSANTITGTPSLVGGEYYNFTPESGFTYDRNGGINDDYGSIEVWASADEIVNNGMIFTGSQSSTDDWRFQLGRYAKDIIFYIKGPNGSFYGRIDVTDVFSVGAWVHIVITRKTGVALYSTAALAYDCYVNGSLVTKNISKTGSGYWLGYIDGYTPWNISVSGYKLNNSSTVTGSWDGKIGRAAIYVNPLTATEVSNNYTELTSR